MKLDDLTGYLASQPLLALAVIAIFLAVAGGTVRNALPWLGRFLQGAGNLGLVAALLLTIVQVTRVTTGNDLALPQLGMPEQQVEGGETRIAMSNDGHFWVQAEINGVPRRFLVDTGATLTAISESTAIEARVPQKPVRQSILMRTANGTVRAEVATLDDLRFGNIHARDLDAVIAPGLGETNVIGMNFLSRLESWRVEGRTLILVPRKAETAPPLS